MTEKQKAYVIVPKCHPNGGKIIVYSDGKLEFRCVSCDMLMFLTPPMNENLLYKYAKMQIEGGEKGGN